MANFFGGLLLTYRAIANEDHDNRPTMWEYS